MRRNKIFKTVFCLAMAAGTAAMAGCDFSEPRTAYDIAVENGFIGSEEDWLNSLKGANGENAASPSINEIYAAWIEAGNSGSFNEFLKEYLSSSSVGENNDTDIIAQNLLSVVSIYTAFDYQLEYQSGYYAEEILDYKSTSAGSGVVYWLDKEHGNGYVVTNFHVVYAAGSLDEGCISDEIYLYPYGGHQSFASTGKKEITVNGQKKSYITGVTGGEGGIPAKYVGGSMTYDVAILEISGSDVVRNSLMQAAKIGDSDTLTVGEKVHAIGNAEGEGISVTSGMLSVTSEYISMKGADEKTDIDFRVMRTDAAINHGNSGGALFDSKGYLIGVPNAKNVEKEVENIGYALPINQVVSVIENITENGVGKVVRAKLGIRVKIAGSNAVFEEGTNRLTIVEKIVVDSVESGSAAAVHGLQVGDVIKGIRLESGEVLFDRMYQSVDYMLNVRKGDKVTYVIERYGEKKEISFSFDQDGYFAEIA